MGGNRARGSWEQTQGQTQSQTQHKQRPQVPALVTSQETISTLIALYSMNVYVPMC